MPRGGRGSGCLLGSLRAGGEEPRQAGGGHRGSAVPDAGDDPRIRPGATRGQRRARRSRAAIRRLLPSTRRGGGARAVRPRPDAVVQPDRGGLRQHPGSASLALRPRRAGGWAAPRQRAGVVLVSESPICRRTALAGAVPCRGKRRRASRSQSEGDVFPGLAEAVCRQHVLGQSGRQALLQRESRAVARGGSPAGHGSVAGVAGMEG